VGFLKTIKVKQDKKTKECYLQLKDFKDIVDIKKVSFYTLEPVHDENDIALILKFYDEDGKFINCKDKK
jgi:hypothetical protein